MGTSQIERKLWEQVGTGRIEIDEKFGNWSGTGQKSRSIFSKSSGTSGNKSIERDYPRSASP